MPLTITGMNGETYKVTDNSNDGTIQANEVAADTGTAVDLQLIQTLLEGVGFQDGATWDLKTVVGKAGQIPSPDPKDKVKVEQLKKKLEGLQTAKGKLEAKKSELKTKIDDKKTTAANKTTAQKDLQGVEAALDATDKMLAFLLKQAQAVANKEGASEEFKQFVKSFSAANGGVDGGESDFGSAKFAASFNTGGAQQSNGAPQGGKAGGVAPGFVPAGPGAFGMPGGGTGFKAAFDPATWYQSSMFMDAKLAAMDDIGAQQLKSQKMLMLFFYFAKMAMSGDMGAMFQFIRFIGTLINRDKATQNVAMAEKLIQLQNASRKATDELLKKDAYDPDDQQVGADFSKLLERTKADQGMIATDQKLIAQMLEEMSQVSEMYTGMMKSVQDSYGRQIQIVSQWRA